MMDKQERLTTADLAGKNHDTIEAESRPVPGEGATPVAAPKNRPAAEPTTPLFIGNEAEQFRSRWMDIQTGFVDDPRKTVEQADGLVAEVMKKLATVFADERGKLEEQWSRGEQADTESLRVALQRYRSFFERLLSA